MAYAQVNLLQTWKIATFLVAFFSSFFSYSMEIDYSKLDGKAPKSYLSWSVSCAITGGSSVIKGIGEIPNDTVLLNLCALDLQNDYLAYYQLNNGHWACNDYYVYSVDGATVDVRRSCTPSDYNSGASGSVGISDKQSGLNNNCPPDGYPNHLTPYDSNSDGIIDECYNPADIAEQLDEQNELDKNEDYCKNLILDSGNNSGSTMCYSANNGAACTVSQVTVGDASYYKGTGTEVLGCASSENDPFDSSGTGDDKDGCIYSDGTNYCEANRDKHCKTVQSVEICDDGCIDDGNNLYCDTSKHPDVGEGESDYFNTNGTCSVIAASASQGFCEEMGGTWDESQDYQETTCPTGTGSCSVATAGLCQACFDAGGTWTPDNLDTQTDETKASIEIAALVKKTNEKLNSLEKTTQVTTESLIATTKLGNEKIIASLSELTKITKDSGKAIIANTKEEKESFTTTTGEIDKSKINSLFDEASKADLQAEIEQLKTDITSFIDIAKNEASSLITITVPSSSGYESRMLSLSQGSFDLSLGRFDYFFKLLSGPIMLLCSLYAAFILLRRD
ncbi:MAG: YkyA family protein [Colwellia sp.]